MRQLLNPGLVYRGIFRALPDISNGAFLRKWLWAHSLRLFFANCSVLDVWWGPEFTSGYTGMSIEEPWLFILVAWLVYACTHRVIISDFLVLSVPHLWWHRAQSFATRPGQKSCTSHLCVPLLDSMSLPIRCSVLRSQCLVLHGISYRSTVFYKRHAKLAQGSLFWWCG